MSKLKLASIVLLVLAGLSIALGAVYVSGENQKYQDAKDRVSSAESAYQDASDYYDAAVSYSDAAWADYNWCIYWCFDEMASALAASDVVDSASTELSAADSALSAANKALDDAASKFNSSAVISGAGAGSLLVAAIVVTVLSRKKQAITTDQDISKTDPNWFCVSCGAANELGLFCIDCGAPKSDAKQITNETNENQAETSNSDSSLAKAKKLKAAKPRNSTATVSDEIPELPKGDK